MRPDSTTTAPQDMALTGPRFRLREDVADRASCAPRSGSLRSPEAGAVKGKRQRAELSTLAPANRRARVPKPLPEPQDVVTETNERQDERQYCCEYTRPPGDDTNAEPERNDNGGQDSEERQALRIEELL